MARLRKFSAYQKVERPYTRVSKFKDQNYVKARPHLTISKFETGAIKKEFSHQFFLISKKAIQIRHNALESARMTANKKLETEAGKKEYFLKIRVYPFHVLRENPLAAGAGADRLSTGMKQSFGKPISAAVQVKKGQKIFEVKVNKKDRKVARKALKRASYKLPCSCRIVGKELKNNKE